MEVVCGRGGGASYIARYLNPLFIKAVDISHKAINYCKSNHKSLNLEFLQGDAQQLPFDKNAFDVVINVESSHCYPNLSVFFDEVYKVLKPDGYVLYADLKQKNLCRLEEKIRKSNFK